MRAVVMVLACVTALHAGIWALLREERSAPDFRGTLQSLSYAPFEGSGHPDVDNIPTQEKIRADLRKLAPLTRAIRLYSSTGGVELVPAIANEFGLKVMVGAWIDKNMERNEREMQAAIELAKRNSNVIGIVVGNETIYRGELKVEDLIELIRRVKRQVAVPVTTGEIWNIWRDFPELASSVDFIAAHVLPYWENYTDDQAVEQAVHRYDLLRQNFPGKRVVIAEFGWPSAGYNLKRSNPGPFEQAVTLRDFVTRADKIGMEYNIVEAIDQPWKFFEGGVGPYWGILNAAREPKFPWTGQDRQRILLERGADRPARRRAAVAADLPAQPADGAAVSRAGDGRMRGRKLGRDHLRLLERALLRVRLRLRPHPRRACCWSR